MDPFWARCRACDHRWIAAYVPMNITTFAKLVKTARCPKCGADDPYCHVPTKDEKDECR